MVEVFQQVLSFGQHCRSRHHARRIFGKHSGRKGVFDWQITPVETLLEYFRRDFSGMFERDDLEIVDGNVTNTRFNTVHMHEFPYRLTQADMDARYAFARKRHDRWCANTHNVIANDYSVLLVLSDPVTDGTLGEIAKAITRFNTRKRFLILNGPKDDHGEDWTGNEDLWTAHLSPFDIRPPMVLEANYVFHRLKANLTRMMIGPDDA